MSLYSIGADPEFFIRDSQRHIAICGKIGGTKDKPRQLGGGYAVQEDNVAVEFNIPPCFSKNEFKEAIRHMSSVLSQEINNMGYLISKHASVSFDQDQLTHPNALVFGCEPDYNAWTRSENEFPLIDDETLRTAGGHIHVGTDTNMIEGTMMMDLYLGVPSIICDNNPASQKRRQLYGKAGAMRPKSYGFEYRTLSNFWIFKPELVSWVWDQTSRAMDSKVRIGVRNAAKIQECINNSDIDLAHYLIDRYELVVPDEVI